MTDLENLAAALAEAAKTRDAFTAKLPGKEAALAEAKEHQQRLVEQSVRGAEIAPKVQKDAGLARAAAEDGLALLKEQITAANAAYDRAKSEHDQAVRAGKLQAVADAKRAVINAADRLARYGAGMTAAAAELTENYPALFAALADAGIVPAGHEMQALAGLRFRIPGAVPAAFQNQIIAGGVARPVDVAQFERSTWLAGAAPDAEADAPYNEAARLHAERIMAEQEFDAATRAVAARNAYPGIPSFQPTDIHSRRGQGAHRHL